MSISTGKVLGVLATALAGPAIALAIASGAPALTPVTIGSTTGSPSETVCMFGLDCTYVPFSGPSTPELQVPLDGTVTSFSINSGSSGNTVELRVLQPAGDNQFTAIATGPAETLATTGVETFSVSLPVKAGDVLALDDATSAIMFDDSSGSMSDTAWFYLPHLADGTTEAPTNQQAGYRLLVSATIIPSPSTTTSGTTQTSPPPTPPMLSHVSESNKTWRAGKKLATVSRHEGHKPPIGTTFKFDLNVPASVNFAFDQLLAGRRVKHKCVGQTSANRHARKCTRSKARGSLTINAPAGADRVVFQGRLSHSKKLKSGNYAVTVGARNAVGASRSYSLKFTIAG